MKSEILELVEKLPEEEHEKVKDFIGYLLSKQKPEAPKNGESIGEMRVRKMGWAKGQVWMADDFDDTPEEFKDYL